MSAFQRPDKQEILGMELVLCHSQPGNLYISRHACAFRYLKAQKMKIHNFGYGANVLNRGLEICQTYPEGRRYAEEAFPLSPVIIHQKDSRVAA